jgi:hypothetical protein
MNQPTPEVLIETIIKFEREFRISPDAHKKTELQGMDPVRLGRIRDFYAEAISLCMIERRV